MSKNTKMTKSKLVLKPSEADVEDEIIHQLALEDAENGPTSPMVRQWSKDLGALIDDRLAELRRNLTPADAQIENGKPIRPSTLAMTRDAIMEAIARLVRTLGTLGTIQYAHRNLKTLSDNDLRRLYDTLDSTPRAE